jgi:hypothetical protein
MCFRKAKDHRGERIAQAHLLEEEGRRCNAVGDLEGSTRNLQSAVELFLKVKLVGDAVRNLERMGKFSEAAGEGTHVILSNCNVAEQTRLMGGPKEVRQSSASIHGGRFVQKGRRLLCPRREV